MICQRWASDHPFAGHTAEILKREAVRNALRPEVHELVRRELLNLEIGQLAN
ncbi:hypothetical protein MMMDOFMJ_4267 [Methylobacterium gnaphalii]|uniref:Uncharacterized protein n=1 Tax=Methylobacterium gnaphalii TaxID=1010610 RepID=A0A512JRR6_9HYPH|nr:hypothetical protein MGN01_45010 [Methylobacterium gnaphalii]GJD71312.1 hypothetical protein MMMDOFMJ_4267 [Methylobacterium gnaphalii]GLS48819.1 hypothetical protein GCM10007885_16650 [Methylobacterium gnaphalii]